MVRSARGRFGRRLSALWDADQAASGIPALATGEAGDPARGFVKIDERAGADPDHRLFAEVRIPEPKRRTYELCKALFDNYRLDQSKPEDNRPEEAREILELLDAVADSAPMAAPRAGLDDQRRKSYSRDQWQELIFDVWFRQFDDGCNHDLSGFEHVAVGEQNGGAVNGHHFWYKYYLDDWAAFSGADDIGYAGSRYDGPHGREGRLSALGREVPEVVTLGYRGDAYDAESGRRRTLYNPIGGFWVGCSIEGLMALGRMRFSQRGRIETAINGAATRSSCTAARTGGACPPSSRVFWAWPEPRRCDAASGLAAGAQRIDAEAPVIAEGLAVEH